MIAQRYKDMLSGKSVIRQISEWSTARGTEIGYENVFDYSLGNPSVPCPEHFTKTCIDLLQTKEPVTLHGYSPTLTIPAVRKAVAESLNRRFGMDYGMEHIFMATGAAGALAHAMRCVAVPGQDIITFAPFFPEYKPYVEGAGLNLKVVPPRTKDFQIDFDAFDAMLDENTAAVLINTPNNPSGVVYTRRTLEGLARLLERKSAEYGHPIYMIADEPYRELAFDGAVVPFVTKYYDNTMVVYSYSKSLSLPGERIGYVVIPDEVEDSADTIAAATIANRISGCVNAPSLIQLAVARCADAEVDLGYYDRNRRTLYEGLTKLGFTCVKPEGAFYLWLKSPEEDERQFVEKAKKYNILMVPGRSFACPGYVRLAYCVSYEKIVKALPEFAKLAKEYVQAL